jgi:glycosyltransferase involved in cell wall biosynthesis
MTAVIRVLHVLGELKPSGAETMLSVAGHRFSAQGVKADILSTGVVLGSYAPQLADAGYKFHHIPFSKSPRFLVDLYRLMRDGNYDVLHLHTERANFWIGLVALAVRPARVLRTIHNNFAFHGFLRLRRMVQRRILHRLGFIHVAISDSVAETESTFFGLKTRIVYDWYDNNHFVPPSKSERRQARANLNIVNETVIVSVGNCSKIKNHTALIEAIARLPVELRPLYLHAGIEEEGQPERRLAEKLGVADRIRFLGPLSDVKPVLYAADLFIMPSLFEGLGIAAIEALATGLPALFADVLGLNDLRRFYNNLIYTSPDTNAIYTSLSKLLAESNGLRSARAVDYPKVSQEFFSIDKGVSGYMEIYRGQ